MLMLSHSIVARLLRLSLGAQSKHEETRPRFVAGSLSWLVFLLFFPYM